MGSEPEWRRRGFTTPEPTNDCSDGNCVLRIGALGNRMRTNGGCLCMKEIGSPLRHKVKRKIDSLRQELVELREAHEDFRREVLEECGKRLAGSEVMVVLELLDAALAKTHEPTAPEG